MTGKERVGTDIGRMAICGPEKARYFAGEASRYSFILIGHFINNVI